MILKSLNFAKLLQLGLYYITQNIPEISTLCESNINNYFSYLFAEQNSNYLIYIGEFTFMEIINHFNVIRELSYLYNNKINVLNNFMKLLEITTQNDKRFDNIYSTLQRGLVITKSNSISPVFTSVYPIITKSVKYFIPFCNYFTNIIKSGNISYSFDIINTLLSYMNKTISFFFFTFYLYL